MAHSEYRFSFECRPVLSTPRVPPLEDKSNTIMNSCRPSSLQSTDTAATTDSDCSIFSIWNHDEDIRWSLTSSSSGTPSLCMARTKSTVEPRQLTLPQPETKSCLAHHIFDPRRSANTDVKHLCHDQPVAAGISDPYLATSHTQVGTTVPLQPPEDSVSLARSSNQALSSSSAVHRKSMTVERKPLPALPVRAESQRVKPRNEAFTSKLDTSAPRLHEPIRSHDPGCAHTSPTLQPPPVYDHFDNYDREMGMIVRSCWEDSDSDEAEPANDRSVVNRVRALTSPRSKESSRRSTSQSAYTGLSPGSEHKRKHPIREPTLARKKSKHNSDGIWRRVLSAASQRHS